MSLLDCLLAFLSATVLTGVISLGLLVWSWRRARHAARDDLFWEYAADLSKKELRGPW